MVQGVLVVQGGLVVLLSERIGGKRERRVYFCIRKNIRAKSESDGRVLQLVPKSALTLHPPGPPSILGGLRGAQERCKALWKMFLTEHILRAPNLFNGWLILGIGAGHWAANGFWLYRKQFSPPTGTLHLEQRRKCKAHGK